MGSLPKPLIGLLVGTVAFFALWMVALKPSSSSSSTGGSQGGLGQYQSAINKAHQAVTTSNQANAKLGAPTATTAAPASPAKTATTSTAATKAAPVTKAKAAKTTDKVAPAAKPAPVSIAAQVTTVENAIRGHKVLAVLFYNPAAADDQSMVKELSAVPAAGAPLVKVAVPVSQLTKFAAITTKIPVVTSPTLVIIDANGRAATLTGYASSGEIRQRITDAIAAK
jgi:hypothetical protein